MSDKPRNIPLKHKKIEEKDGAICVAGCSQEEKRVAEWMEGEKLGAVTGRKRNERGGVVL